MDTSQIQDPLSNLLIVLLVIGGFYILYRLYRDLSDSPRKYQKSDKIALRYAVMDEKSLGDDGGVEAAIRIFKGRKNATIFAKNLVNKHRSPFCVVFYDAEEQRSGRFGIQGSYTYWTYYPSIRIHFPRRRIVRRRK